MELCSTCNEPIVPHPEVDDPILQDLMKDEEPFWIHLKAHPNGKPGGYFRCAVKPALESKKDAISMVIALLSETEEEIEAAPRANLNGEEIVRDL